MHTGTHAKCRHLVGASKIAGALDAVSGANWLPLQPWVVHLLHVVEEGIHVHQDDGTEPVGIWASVVVVHALNAEGQNHKQRWIVKNTSTSKYRKLRELQIVKMIVCVYIQRQINLI